MPTNGGTKPFVGINLVKNRIRGPQIFSTRKWTWILPYKIFLAEIGYFDEKPCEWFLNFEELITGLFLLHRVVTKKMWTGFEPFGNKIFAVEFVQIAHIISTQAWAPVSCFSYKARGDLWALFWYNITIACSRYHDDTYKLCLFLL